MAGKARWGQVWDVDLGLGGTTRFVVVSEGGWNEVFSTVIAVRLAAAGDHDDGPGFPLLKTDPPTIAICGEVTTLHEDDLVDVVDHLAPTEMQRIAVGLLEVTQAHRLLGVTHPQIAERLGKRRRRSGRL